MHHNLIIKNTVVHNQAPILEIAFLEHLIILLISVLINTVLLLENFSCLSPWRQIAVQISNCKWCVLSSYFSFKRFQRVIHLILSYRSFLFVAESFQRIPRQFHCLIFCEQSCFFYVLCYRVFSNSLCWRDIFYSLEFILIKFFFIFKKFYYLQEKFCELYLKRLIKFSFYINLYVDRNV